MGMNGRLLRPRASGFNPSSLGNLQMWFDATDASTITTVSGAVSQWNSKAGSITATQTTANNRPTYLSSGINNRPALSFDGTNDSLATTYNANLITGHQSYAAVVTANSPAAYRALLYARGSQANGLQVNSTTPRRWTIAHRADANTYNSSAGGAALAQPQVVVITISATTLTIRVDGVQGTASGTFASGSGETSAVFEICRDSLGPSFFPATVGELLMYDRTLTATEMSTIEKYLARKWGVTLP